MRIESIKLNQMLTGTEHVWDRQTQGCQVESSEDALPQSSQRDFALTFLLPFKHARPRRQTICLWYYVGLE